MTYQLEAGLKEEPEKQMEEHKEKTGPGSCSVLSGNLVGGAQLAGGVIGPCGPT